MYVARERPASEARLTVLSERQRADALRRGGARVASHGQRHWVEVRPGFYEPVHLLCRLEVKEAVRPARLCWGFRAALREEDARLANATLPLHLLPDLGAFDVEALSPRRRSKLRKSRREAAFVQMDDASLLQAQGYALYVSHLERTRHKRIPSLEEYLAAVARLMTDGSSLALAAVVRGRLAGYAHGIAVGGVAYVDDVVVGSEFLGQQLGIGLNVEFIEACQRTPGVQTLVHGLHAREDRGLDEFKSGLGFRVVQVPARVAIPLPLRWYLRARRRHAYYRLTGR